MLDFKARQSVERILCNCVTCKWFEGFIYAPVNSPDLPVEHVSEEPLYCHIGLNFAGSIYLQNNTDQSKGYHTVLQLLAINARKASWSAVTYVLTYTQL